jgi:hypothetical protein
MNNDEYEKHKKKDSNENLNNQKYGPEIKFETYPQFYLRKFKRDFVYCKVKI